MKNKITIKWDDDMIVTVKSSQGTVTYSGYNRDMLADAIKPLLPIRSTLTSTADDVQWHYSPDETFTEARKNKDMFYRDKDAWLK